MPKKSNAESNLSKVRSIICLPAFFFFLSAGKLTNNVGHVPISFIETILIENTYKN